MAREKIPDECPMNPESVRDMTATLKNIDQRLQSIERMMFAGRVALYVVMGCASVGWWFFQNVDYIKHGISNWLRN
ncbi:hypothetical protein [Nitrosomonas sp. Nm34]|uniref:hypothetical protein n=1 Tax=Nitrosomonas sp. Nm34 TaxID=1881055 RepID=UPI000B83D7BB|nr:hypothetical protein [Nitrosomonas sp. Nm34]